MAPRKLVPAVPSFNPLQSLSVQKCVQGFNNVSNMSIYYFWTVTQGKSMSLIFFPLLLMFILVYQANEVI